MRNSRPKSVHTVELVGRETQKKMCIERVDAGESPPPAQLVASTDQITVTAK